MSKVNEYLENIYHARLPNQKELTYLLSCSQKEELTAIFDYANQVRQDCMGEGVLLRGIIEFSNVCNNSCAYCGLRSENTQLTRYRLTEEQIMTSVTELVSYAIKTVVLQSGEDDAMSIDWLGALVAAIKARFGIALTLSIGERSADDYRFLHARGVDRYLLKIETTNADLYQSMHTGRLLSTRLSCLRMLRSLGYQVGCGIMVGLPGQTIESIARDIIFFAKENFDMIGIGPFIPHAQTPLAHASLVSHELVLKTIALTRISMKYVHLPATTALGSLKDDYRMEGLGAGANVLMPNFTPASYKPLYQIYPGKRCNNESGSVCVGCLSKKVKAIGRTIDYAIGHSLKR